MAWIEDQLILKTEAADPKAFLMVRLALQHAFSGPQGEMALGAILTTLRFHREAANDEERILQNGAKRILYLLGSWTPGNESTLNRAYRNAPVLTKEKSHEIRRRNSSRN